MVLTKIQKLLPNLPEKDYRLSLRFIQERKFEALKEIVDSSIYKIRKKLGEDETNEEYLKYDLEGLNALKLEVDYYVEMLTLPLQEEDYDYEQ